MNLIHAICLSKIHINQLPKWKIVSIYKENKLLNNNINKFLNLDIFDASDNIITFLLSLKELPSESVWGVTYDINFINIDMGTYCTIDGYKNESIVTYYPKSNRFEITDKNISYTIYRNTKNSSIINKIWEPLTDDLKNIYLDIIFEATRYI